MGLNHNDDLPDFEKGGATNVESQRGISLLEVTYTVPSLTIVRRIQVSICCRRHRKIQTGIRESTIDHIFTLKQIMKKYYE